MKRCISYFLLLAVSFLLLGETPNHYPVNREGLVGWWSYRNSGRVSKATEWIDKADSSRYTTLSGNTSIDSNGANFSSNGDYIHCSNGSHLNITDSYTLVAWINPTSYGPHTNGLGRIFERNDGSNGFSLFLNKNYSGLGQNNLVFVRELSDVSTSGYTANDTISLSTWQMVAVTYDGTTLKLYIDGSLDTSITANYDVPSNTATFTISESGTLNFDGKIDNCQVYNDVALSADDIEDIYNAGRTGDIPSTINRDNLDLWQSYTFSGIPGNWRDYSGNGNNGTCNGGAYVNNQGANFDGSDDYTDHGNILGFERNEQFSFVFWIKTSNTTDYPTILAKRDYSTNIGYTVYFRQSTGYLGIVLRNDNEILEVHGDDNIADGSWHFCAISYNGSSSPSGFVMYVDDSLQSLTTLNNSLSSTIINSNTFKLGTWGNPPSQFLDGNLDDVMIFNRALSVGEIKLNYLKNKRN